MLEAVDSELGRLFRSVPDELKDATIILIGDNGTFGPMVQEPFDATRAKGTVYEGGVNVPLIVAGPLVTSPGRECAALVHSVDLLSGPTARSFA